MVRMVGRLERLRQGAGLIYRDGSLLGVRARIAGEVNAESKLDKEAENQISRMSELYPKYYKDVSRLSEIDVYAVHDLFAINDPSGCIQHASKKLLLSGVRTGGKSAYEDIREARDTLNRKLELMECKDGNK